MSEWVSIKDHLPPESGIYLVAERGYVLNYADHITDKYDEIHVAYYFQYAHAFELCYRIPSECNPDFWMVLPSLPELPK